MSIIEQIAKVMDCTPSDDDDLVEAVRLLVRERNAAEDEATRQRERAKRAERTVEDVTRERDEARRRVDELEREFFVEDSAVVAVGQRLEVVTRERDSAREERDEARKERDEARRVVQALVRFSASALSYEVEP